MATVDDNRKLWDGQYDWRDRGDEWSGIWGSAEAQWNFSLLPRLHRLVPASTILEIAPGFGRWTQFLLDQCERLIGVDLSKRCVDACIERFAPRPNADFYVNNGSSLPMVKSDSVDFAFSFDSLVHVEWVEVAAYLVELARVLSPDGTAFIHHSNVAALRDGHTEMAGRAASVSGDMVLAQCARLGLSVVSQERIDWEGYGLIDCITVFTRRPGVGPSKIVENHSFMSEANRIGAISDMYC